MSALNPDGSILISNDEDEERTLLKKKKHKSKKIHVKSAESDKHHPSFSSGCDHVGLSFDGGRLTEGHKKQKKKRKEEEEFKEQNTKRKKRKHMNDDRTFGEIKDSDQAVGQKQIQKKRKRDCELKEERKQERVQKHQRKKDKRKKSKNKEKSFSSRKKDHKKYVIKCDDDNSLQKKSKKQKRKKKLEDKEKNKRKRSVEVISEKDNELENKKRKGKAPKPETQEDAAYDPIHFMWFPSEDIKEKFNVREGKWTKKEEKILKENMERYLRVNNLDDPSKLIFAHHNDDSDEAQKWKEFARTTNFYRELAKGLNRGLFFVYRKVLRSFDQNNYLGRFTESEDKELKRLVALHGRKWAKIGKIMERSGLAVNHRFKLIADDHEQGKWKDSEVDLLKEAVRKVTNTEDGEEVFTNVNWDAVASIVKTRNQHQCRKKWLGHVCWMDCKMSTQKRWGGEEDIQLIKKVYESSVTEECDIDWYDLQKDFDMARSPEWLQLKFNVLLKKYCNSIDLENTEFEDVIDYLYKVKSIELQDKYCDHQDTSLA